MKVLQTHSNWQFRFEQNTKDKNALSTGYSIQMASFYIKSNKWMSDANCCENFIAKKLPPKVVIKKQIENSS